MSTKLIHGRVRSEAHGTSIISPGFPRVPSPADSKARNLHDAGFTIELTDARFAVGEPAAKVDAEFAPVEGGSFSGPRPGTQRTPGRKLTADERSARAHLRSQLPLAAAHAVATVTAPDGTSVEFPLVTHVNPRIERVARNRMLPVDVVNPIISTLAAWGHENNVELPQELRSVGTQAVAALDS